MKNDSLKDMIKFFEDAARATFGSPSGGASLIAKAGMAESESCPGCCGIASSTRC